MMEVRGKRERARYGETNDDVCLRPKLRWVNQLLRGNQFTSQSIASLGAEPSIASHAEITRRPG